MWWKLWASRIRLRRNDGRRKQPAELIGRQVVAVCNFPPKRIAGVVSEVLVLGGIPEEGDVVLLAPDFPVPNGARIA